MPACWPGGCGWPRSGPARPAWARTGLATARASVAVELVGEHATLTLTLVVDPASGVLRQADLFP